MLPKSREIDSSIHDEPCPDPHDLMDHGGECVVVQGFTSGGVPYGQRLTEFRESSAIDDEARPWARARRALALAAEKLDLAAPDVGWVRKIGAGLSHLVFAAEVDSTSWGMESSRVLVVSIPAPGRLFVPQPGAASAAALGAEHEARLLTFLASQELPFRVSGVAVAVPTATGPVVVREFLEGIPADLRVGRTHSTSPWELVGEVAAAIHEVDVGPLGWLPGYGTRRAHGEALTADLADLENAGETLASEALAWLREHRPPDEPARLVHGDLLGQNLLLWPGSVTGVLDWEFALRGDPAYDLAIVTRGVRRPFQVRDGLRNLLEVHGQHAPQELREEEVRFHEICLHLTAIRAAVRGEEAVEPLESVLARLRNLLRWVGV